METSTTGNDNDVKESPTKTYYYAFYALNTGNLVPSKTNLPDAFEGDVRKVLNTRLEKDQVFSGLGTVVTVEHSSVPPAESSQTEEQSTEESAVKRSTCYYFGQAESSASKAIKFIICFLCEEGEPLELFRSELDHYVQEMVSSAGTELQSVTTLPQSVCHMLETWHVVTIEYLARCIQALKDNLKYLIHSALLDNRLVTSGGTIELQSDIQRFYKACSLSEILTQMRESRLQDAGSLGGSVDMLVDLNSATTDQQGTITVSLSADSVKLDATGFNRYCEDWANALNRPDFQTPARLRQVIEAFKLKFIQTMNNLKRLLREADNDYYALYRSYNFLRDSGNSDILLHYVMAESGLNSNSVLSVLQEFMQEQQQQQQQQQVS